MKKLTNYLLPIQTKDLYAKEAVSSISLAHDVADKINEIVTYLNTHEDLTAEKILEQDGKIRKGIIYMKDNLANTINDLLELMKSNGEMDELISEFMRKLSSLVVNVKEYGAIGDGKNDDSIAIQKAIDENPNKTIFIPDGTYIINNTLKLNSNQSLIGGTSATLKLNNDKVDLISIEEKHHIRIENLNLIYDFELDQLGSTINSYAIKGGNSPYNKFKNLTIKGFNYGIYCGERSWCCDFQNVTTQSCNYGVYSNGEFNNVSFINYRSTYCKCGAYAGGGRTINFKDSQFEKNEIGLTKCNLGDFLADGCYFEGNLQDVEVKWGTTIPYKVTLNDCSFFKGNSQVNDDKGCINLHGNEKTLIIIRNCSFTRNGSHTFRMIDFTSGSKARVLVEDNYIDGYSVLGQNKVLENLVDRNSFDLRKSSLTFKHSHTPKYVSANSNNQIMLTGEDESIRFSSSNDIEVYIPSTNEYQNSYEILATIQPGKSVIVKKNNDGDSLINGNVYTNNSGAVEYKLGKIIYLGKLENGSQYLFTWVN